MVGGGGGGTGMSGGEGQSGGMVLLRVNVEPGQSVWRRTLRGWDGGEKGTDELETGGWGIVFGEDVESVDEDLSTWTERCDCKPRRISRSRR